MFFSHRVFSLMFSTIARASDSVRDTQGRPAALSEMLSMVCPHNYTEACKDETIAPGKMPHISNTVRMYNKLMCGHSYCGNGSDSKVEKLIK
jgi:hypothetical protein